MPNVRLTLTYDGTAYHGWQRQPGLSTLQGVLEDRLARLAGEPINVAAAARTDAGVHAVGQVVNFKTAARHDEATWPRALNALLPADIVVLDGRIVPDTFHARRTAKSKRYRYSILNRRERSPLDRSTTWHVPVPLDVSLMAEAAKGLIGRHDFTSFAATGHQAKTALCTMLETKVVSEGNQVTLWFEADRFLQHMVRTLVGTLVEVGRDRVRADEVAGILAGRDRRLSGPTAPARGLCLVEVRY